MEKVIKAVQYDRGLNFKYNLANAETRIRMIKAWLEGDQIYFKSDMVKLMQDVNHALMELVDYIYREPSHV